jgi:hypothetical protein
VDKFDGLLRAYQTLESQYNQNLAELEKLNEERSVVPEHVVDEGLDSVRTVPRVSEGP